MVVRRLVTRDWDRGSSIRVYAVRAVLRAPWAGLSVRRDLGNGSPVFRGEVLAAHDDEALEAPGDGVVLLPQQDVARGAAAALFAEDRGEVLVDHRAWMERLEWA